MDDDLALQAPEADAAEQARALIEVDDSAQVSVPADVEAADVVEQSRVVEQDEDDYR